MREWLATLCCRIFHKSQTYWVIEFGGVLVSPSCPMNTYSKIADGLSAWLTFEQRCGRVNLFSESSLAHPLGQLLQYRYEGRVRAEVEHPVLAPFKTGAGQKPRIDFVVDGVGGMYDLVVETKWVSESPTLLRDVIRDIVRLDLLLGVHAREALFVLAGEKRTIARLFSHRQFQPHPQHLSSKHILPLGNHTKASVRFVPIPQFRRSLYVRVLKPYCGIPVSNSIRVERSGPFPRNASSKSHEVYLWRLIKHIQGPTFIPEAEYPELAPK